MISLYLLPMYAVIHQWTAVGVCAGVLVVVGIVLWRVWYPNLPATDEQ